MRKCFTLKDRIRTDELTIISSITDSNEGNIFMNAYAVTASRDSKEMKECSRTYLLLAGQGESPLGENISSAHLHDIQTKESTTQHPAKNAQEEIKESV
jgi:hypothetical protein